MVNNSDRCISNMYYPLLTHSLSLHGKDHPINWQKAIVMPLFKHGDIKDRNIGIN